MPPDNHINNEETQINPFDDICISRSYNEQSGTVESEYINISSFRNFNDSIDITSFLGGLGLLQINDYTFRSPMNGGQASLTLLYENEDMKCIVKILVSPRNNEEYQSFVSEYAALKKLEMQQIQDFKACPNILIDFSQKNNMPVYYFGMEFLEGETLKSLIDEEPLPWSWEKSLNVTHRIAIALSEIHIQGFVHRDLHPGNILINNTEETYDGHRLTELGIRILDLGNRANSAADLFGIPNHDDLYRPKGAVTSWSPEYLLNRGELIGTKQDIWSLGIIFYHLLTNKYPIQAENISDLIEKYNSGSLSINWAPILSLQLPRPIQHLLRRMLDFNQNTRIHTGPVTRICYDIRFEQLLDSNEDYITGYLEVDGQVDDPLDYIY